MAIVYMATLVGTAYADSPVPPDRQQLLIAVGKMIETDHYSPQIIDDAFSLTLWNREFEGLDPYKQFFFQKDLGSLRKYQRLLDDEIHGKRAIAFLPELLSIYAKRVSEAESEYRMLLSRPFSFDSAEEVGPGGATLTEFPSKPGEMSASRRKRIKYLVLQQYYLLLDQIKGPLDSVKLESQARAAVELKIQRSLETVREGMDIDIEFSAYLNRLAAVMDPHSSYLSSKGEKELMNRMGNRYAGIGAQLGSQPLPEGVLITGLESGGPAFNSRGIRAGDVIIKVGEGPQGVFKELAGRSVAEVISMIRGEVGSIVRLVIRRPESGDVTVVLQRAQSIENGSLVKQAVIERDNKRIGYITFPLFYESNDPLNPQHCSDDVESALLSLKAQGVSGIIFDLRGNGGGSLREVVKMVSLLISAGPVVQVRDNKGYPVARSAKDADMMNSTGRPFSEQVYDGPVVVLIDERSASASEIFAAAIQDYQRGLIMGSSSSFGKGSVQKTQKLPLEAGGSLQLTYAQFYRVNGSSTQIKGVSSDIILPDLNEYLKIRERDTQNPMPWDMVAAKNFQPSGSVAVFSTIAQAANRRVSQDPVFIAVDRLGRLLADEMNKKVSLKLNEYVLAANRLKELNSRGAGLTKLPAEKELIILPAVTTADDSLPPWIKVLKQDIYVDQAVQAVCWVADR